MPYGLKKPMVWNQSLHLHVGTDGSVYATTERNGRANCRITRRILPFSQGLDTVFVQKGIL